MFKSNLKMKNLKYFFLPVVFILSSCYIYKPYSEKEEITAKDPKSSQKSISLRDQQNTSSLTAQKTKGVSLKGDITEEEKIKIKQEEANQQYPVTNPSKSSPDGKVMNPSANNNLSGTPMLAQSTNEVGSSKSSKPTETKGETNPNAGKGGLKAKIQPNKYYKISVEEKEYKIQADKWEGDTLVSHILRKPNRVLKFHENQIDEELLKERRFSKAYSDLFTVGAYAAGGAAVLLLLL